MSNRIRHIDMTDPQKRIAEKLPRLKPGDKVWLESSIRQSLAIAPTIGIVESKHSYNTWWVKFGDRRYWFYRCELYKVEKTEGK